MSREIVRVDPPQAPAPSAPPGRRDLIAMFLAGRSPRTLDAYARDLADFAGHVGMPSAGAAIDWLIGLEHGQANAIALGWRNAMVEAKRAPATTARRLGALRSVVRLARTLGLVSWTLEVRSPRVETLKDTAGPGAEGWRSMLATAKADADDAKGLRDLALIRLMHDTALRVSEAIGLDLADVELDRDAIRVTAKGSTEKTRLTIPPQVKEALVAWLAIRGDRPGPVFHRLDRAADPADPGRLTPRAVHLIVGEIAERADVGRRVWPHALRHAGITDALDKTGGDYRAALKFSRHRKIETILRYDDNRRDDFGRLAGLVAED